MIGRRSDRVRIAGLLFDAVATGRPTTPRQTRAGKPDIGREMTRRLDENQTTFLSRRRLIGYAAFASLTPAALATPGGISALRTPFKLNRLVLGPSNVPGSFDEKKVDDPFVFRANGRSKPRL